MPSLAQRRKTFVLTSTVGVILVGIFLVLLNILANWAFFRLDLTHNQSYSLSTSSKKLVHGLDDTVLIKAFFTPDLPAPYNVYERYVRDMLTEYRSASHGHVRFEFVLPYPPQDFEKRAQEAGLNPLQMEQQGSDQLAIRRVFMGLVLYYHDKTETIPVVKDIQELEFTLTTKIARMTARSKKTICYTTGHGEADWSGPKSHVTDGVDALYNLRPVNLTTPVDGDGLLVVGPTQKLTDQALWEIDQTLMHGTPVAFLVDSKNIMVSQFMAAPFDAGLDALLTHYGFKLGHRLAYDAQAESIGVSQTVAGFTIPMQIKYPFIPVVTHFDKQHPLARGLETLSIPFPTTVDPVSPLPPGVTYTGLFETSPRSWLLPERAYSVSPAQIPVPKNDDPHGPYPLGAVIEGTFTSFFQGKPSPSPNEPFIERSPKTSVVVIGTSHIVDPALPVLRGATALVSNLFAWVSRDDVLLGIRSKGEILRPLKPLTEFQHQWVVGSALALPSLFVAGLGLFLWRRRQAWRRRLGGL